MESAGVEASTRGNDAGTASQIRPQAVSVWVGVPFGSIGDGVGPPGTSVSSAVGEEADADGAAGIDDAVVDGCAEVLNGVGAAPSPLHAVARKLAASRQPSRRTFLERRGFGRVTRSS